MARTKKAKDLTGTERGWYTFLEHRGGQDWLVRCRCGVEKVVKTYQVKPDTKCRACWAKDRVTHGHGRSSDPTYSSWNNMKSRCKPPKGIYFLKGIKVCRNWRESFEEFLKSMKTECPKRCSIDRADNDESTRHYSCGHCEECIANGWVFHCRWATDSEQMLNSAKANLRTYQGKTQAISEWAKEPSVLALGISAGLLQLRFSRGWSEERAFTTPQRPMRKG